MSARIISTYVAVSAVCIGLYAAPAGGQRQGTQQVVVRVVSGHGLPVTDLKADDLSIRTDGRAREITSLELVKPSPAAPGTPAATGLPAPFVTNVAPPAGHARELVVAIDEDGIASRRDEPIREVIVKLIETLGPHEFVGLTSLRNGGPTVAPTTDHESVIEALPKFMSAAASTESASDLACRTRHMMGTISGLLTTGGPERTIIAFVAGMSPVTEQTVKLSLVPNASACEIRARDLDDLHRVAIASAPATYVVVFPGGAISATNKSVGEAGAESVAGALSADLIRFTAGPEPVIDRITAAAGTYYLAALDGPSAETVRRVDVRVDRDDVRAMARPVSAGPRAQVFTRQTTFGTGEQLSPREMIRVPTRFSDLPLRAAGFVSRQASSNDLRVVALFEPIENLKLESAVVGLFDEKGSLKAQWTAQAKELGRSPAVGVLAAAPGIYRLRIAATDASGRRGTVDVPLKVELSDAANLELGTLLLGADQSTPKLLFRAGDNVAIGFLQVYGVTRDTPLAVTYELRDSERLPPIGTAEGTILRLPDEPDGRLVWGGFDLSSLEPGDYLLRAVVSLNGREVGAASRTLRKEK